MKITNKTVAWAIPIMILGIDYWNSQCGWSEFRVVVLKIQFEYEIKLPKSKRKTLNNLYSKMGEAAMRGDEAEEKRLWNVIQKIEKQ